MIVFELSNSTKITLNVTIVATIAAKMQPLVVVLPTNRHDHSVCIATPTNMYAGWEKGDGSRSTSDSS